MIDENVKAYIIHIAFLIFKILIYLTQKAQITLLLAKKVIIPIKYLNYANIFSKKSVAKLSKQIDINKYVSDLEPSKQSFYKLIYNFRLVKLKIFKLYII